MDTKSLTGFEIKDEAKGEVQATFATLNVKDKDDDVTIPGAFTEGAPVVISAYGHKSWEGALPVGKGTIHEVGDEVVMKGQFFMDTTAGREHFAVVKALGARQEWSYGFNVEDSEQGDFEGKSVRYLKKMAVHEVSPVMRGAGIGTGTTYAKAEKKTLNEEISCAVATVRDAVESAGRVAALRAEKGKGLSNINHDGLVELEMVLGQLKSLLDTEEEEVKESDDEVTKLYLESIAATMESE